MVEEQEATRCMAEPIMDWILNGIPVPVNVKLFDDVGSIYEALLAKMELSSWWKDLEAFRKRGAYFEEVNGEKTFHYYISNIKGKGQIGRTCQYLTHWFYPYKAKFHPQMIKALINWMGLKGKDKLLDPFVGSGTTLIEAKTIGVDSWGVDINPLCTLMSKVKCELLDLNAEMLEAVPREKIFHYFNRKMEGALGKASNLEAYVKTVENESKLISDDRVYRFYQLCYLYALSDYTYIKKSMWDGFNNNLNAILKTVEKFQALKEELKIQLGTVEVLEGDARKLSEMFPKESFAGIITSPPYSIAVDYIKNDLHALSYLNINSETLVKDMVGLRGKGEARIVNYYKDMMDAFKEMNKVLQPNRYCITIIGDVTYKERRLPIHQKYIEFAEDAGFALDKLIKRPILGGYARLRYEYILIFKKVKDAE
ncbi:MAG: DNA methyltransferase [Candidatus Jordarchaeaceae archaeon]